MMSKKNTKIPIISKTKKSSSSLVSSNQAITINDKPVPYFESKLVPSNSNQFPEIKNIRSVKIDDNAVTVGAHKSTKLKSTESKLSNGSTTLFRKNSNAVFSSSNTSEQGNDQSQSRNISTLNPSSYNMSRSKLFTRQNSQINVTTTEKQSQEQLATCNRRRSYDVIETRKYIKEQRHKRKLPAAGTAVEAKALEREIIKERLQNLKKTTKKIIDRNVNRVKKRGTIVNTTPSSSARSLRVSKTVKDFVANSNLLESKSTNKVDKKQKNADIDQAATVSSKSINKEKLLKKILLDSNKKIGILRKTDSDNKTNLLFSNPNFNKNNESETSLLTNQQNNDDGELNNKVFSPISTEFTKAHITSSSLKLNSDQSTPNLELNFDIDAKLFQELPNKINGDQQSKKTELETDITDNDLKLKVPKVALKSKLLEEKSIQVDNKFLIGNEQQIQLPFWLRKTSVPHSPYNFITAVRKKLEVLTLHDQQYKAISTETHVNPSFIEKGTQKPSESSVTTKKVEILNSLENENLPKHYSKSISDKNSKTTYSINYDNTFTSEPPLTTSSAAAIRTNNLKQLKDNSTDLFSSATLLKTTKNSSITENNPQSSSEAQLVSSNFSSITLNVPKSGTISDISSINTEFNNNQQQITKNNNILDNDDTTISSSVFSSPEKHSINKTQNKENTINKKSSDSENANYTYDILRQRNFTSPFDNNDTKIIFKKPQSYYTKIDLKNDNLIVPSVSLFDKINQLQDETKSDQFTYSISVNQTTNKDPSNSISTQLNGNGEDLNMKKFLKDFNKSLSQVIEVNQQLRQKSHETPSKNVRNSPLKDKSISDYYSSDFEKISEISYKSQITENEETDRKIHVATTTAIKTKITTTTTITNSISSIKNSSFSLSNISNKSVKKNTTKSLNKRSSNESDTSTKSVTEELTNYTEKTDRDPTSTEIEIVIEPEVENTAIAEEQVNESDTKCYQSESENLFDKSKYIQSHIKIERGNDFDTNLITLKRDNEKNMKNKQLLLTKQNNSISTTTTTTVLEKLDSISSSSHKSSKKSLLPNDARDSITHQSDKELSIVSVLDNFTDNTLNYSSIGFYEQLLKNETNKSEYLTALLKIREKIILDRTRGQIALLEIQKEKCKSKGLTVELPAIKKKQRAILLRMEREKDEIKKLLKSQNEQSQKPVIFRENYIPPRFLEDSLNLSFKKNLLLNNGRRNSISNCENGCGINSNASTGGGNPTIIRGYELEIGRSLETILRKREEELRKRREHVKRLLQWHHRLDEEEKEIYEIEKMLFDHNMEYQQKQQSTKIMPQNIKLLNEEIYVKDKISEINKSLKELQNVSTSSSLASFSSATTSTFMSSPVSLTKNDVENISMTPLNNEQTQKHYDSVKLSGKKLNKLWNNLTGRKEDKFNPDSCYKLTKKDVEKLYEKAKITVLSDFGRKREIKRFLEQDTSMKLSDSDSVAIKNDLKSKKLVSIKSISTITSSHSDFSSNSSTISNKNDQQSLKENQENDNLKTNSNESINTEQGGSLNNNVNENSAISTEISVIISENAAESVTNGHNSSLFDKNELNFSEKTLTPTTINEEISENDDTASTLKNSSMDCGEDIEFISGRKEQTNDNHVSEPVYSENFETTSIITTLNGTSTNEEVKTDTKLSDNLSSENDEIKEILNESENFNNSSSKLDDSLNLKVDIDIEIEIQKSEEKSLNDSNQLSDKEYSSENFEEKESFTSVTKDEEENEMNLKENSKSDDKSDSMTITNGHNQSSSPVNFKEEFLLFLEQNKNKPVNSEIEAKCGTEKEEINDVDLSTKINGTGDISLLEFESIIDDSSELNDSKSDELLEDNKNSNGILKENGNVCEITQDDKLPVVNGENSSPECHSELEKRLIVIDESLKDLNETFERALSPEKVCLLTQQQQKILHNAEKKDIDGNEKGKKVIPPPPPLAPQLSSTTENQQKPPIAVPVSNSNIVRNYLAYPPENSIVTTATSPNGQLMPDIINEVELRRRQQIMFENEIRHLEHEVPYVFLREIPNKPPPPYVPPAHGSPMTVIFPSEQRIQDITFRRTQELYEEIVNESNNHNQKKTDSILNENITNIYERIILDICKERVDEYKLSLTNRNPENFKYPLILYNPPDRLKCLQNIIYKHVRKVFAMDDKNRSNTSNTTQFKRTSSNYFNPSIPYEFSNRKCDQVDEILIQELYEEEHKWTNFDLEENEIKENVINKIFNNILTNAIKDCESSIKFKKCNE